MAKKVIDFFTQDIWRIRVGTLRTPHAMAIRGLRTLFISIREFINDQCVLRASALTFYSLLSIVPVFAMAFGLAKGFGMDKMLREKLLENAEGQQEVFTRIIEFSENMLQNTRGGLIAGIGLMFLFWTVIKVLGNIESSFNDIWGIKKHRTLGQKFTDYLSLMLIAPIIFLVGSSFTVFIVSQVQNITEKVAILGFFGPVILTVLKILPYGVFWGLLTYLYMFIPNAKINFKSALLGGIVAGTVYQITQWGYIYFQIGASKAGAIYGSFAALPLFLMWLQISWLIVLYGAELSFAHQNEETFEFEPDCLSVNYETKKLLSLRIAQVCVRRFTDGLTPLAAEEIASYLETPVRLTRELLHNMTVAGVLSVARGKDERDSRYQPARDVEDMTIKFVIDLLEKKGTQDIPVTQTPELEQLRTSLRAFDEAVKKLPDNLSLKQLSPLPTEKEKIS